MLKSTESGWSRLISDDYAGTACLFLQDYKKAESFFNDELKLATNQKRQTRFIRSAKKGLDLASKRQSPSGRASTLTQKFYDIAIGSTGVPIVEMRAPEPKQQKNNQSLRALNDFAAATSAEDAGDYTEALRHYSNAIQSCPDDPRLLSGLASCKISIALLDPEENHQGLESAKDFLERAIKIDKGNWRLQNNLAAYYFATEEFDDALRELKKLKSYKDVPFEQSIYLEKAVAFISALNLLKENYPH